MQAIGVDLSKNHFGFCHVNKNGKITLRYVYFKEYLQKERKTQLGQYFQIKERVLETEKYCFEKIKVGYDNDKYNQIESDALKSQIALRLLEEYLINIDGPKFVVLEDYIMSGTKIVQLVHIGESFKYQFTNKEKWKSVVLFVCSLQTWQASLCGHIKTPKGIKQTPYEKIAIALKDDPTYQFIQSLQESNEVNKDLIDSFGLANMYKHYNEVFLAKYAHRIYVF